MLGAAHSDRGGLLRAAVSMMPDMPPIRRYLVLPSPAPAAVKTLLCDVRKGQIVAKIERNKAEFGRVAAITSEAMYRKGAHALSAHVPYCWRTLKAFTFHSPP